MRLGMAVTRTTVIIIIIMIIIITTPSRTLGENYIGVCMRYFLTYTCADVWEENPIPNNLISMLRNLPYQ